MRGGRVVDGTYHAKRGRAALATRKRERETKNRAALNSYGLSTVHTTGRRVDEATSGEDHR